VSYSSLTFQCWPHCTVKTSNFSYVTGVSAEHGPNSFKGTTNLNRSSLSSRQNLNPIVIEGLSKWNFHLILPQT